MSERITEAELRDLFEEADYENIETTTPRRWDSVTVLRLVAEVRRLRGLIAKILGSTMDGVWCDTSEDERALEAESRAIREE